MSNLSNGDKPKGEGPNPRRRRKKRPADAQQKAHQALVAGVAANKKNPPEVSQEGRTASSHENKDGSDFSAAIGNVSNDARGTDEGQVLRTPNKRRRYPYRQKKNMRYDNMRNLRSPQQPTPDAVFKRDDDKQLHDCENKEQPRQNIPSLRPKQNHAHRGRPSNAYAALDLGTNNCRLLIAVPQDKGGFRVIDGFSKIVRLGEGLSQTGMLSQEAMDRSVEALKVCAAKLGNRVIKRQRLIATEACRQASNGDAFLKRVKAESGLDLEIVSRETEARLATEGCGSLMDRKSDGAVLFDIGGGSSELILVNNIGARKKKISERIVAWTSLPMGVVTLAERFGGQNVSRKVFENMVQDVLKHIDAFEGKDALKAAFSHGRVHLLGTSGTVTTLAGIHLDLPRYDRKRVDGIWLHDNDVENVINKLLAMSYEERARNPCIGNERADLVLAGCAILNAIRLTWPTKRLRVADRGLREGLLAEMMNLDGVWSRNRNHQRYAPKRKADTKHKEQDHKRTS